MIKANHGKEIVIRVLNDIGVVAEITKCLAERGLSVAAVSAWVEGADGVIHLVIDDSLRAADCLKEKFHPKENDVVLVELANKPGMLRRLSEELKGARIDIHHLYASVLPDQETCLVVFSSSNNDRALLALNKQ